MPIQLVAVFILRHSQLGQLGGAAKMGVGRPREECGSGPGLRGGGGVLVRGEREREREMEREREGEDVTNHA